jgi:hypothetical protein
MSEKDDWLDEENEIDVEAEEWLSLQAPPEGDVLTPKAEKSIGENAFLSWLYEDEKPKTAYPVVPGGAEPKYVETIKSLQRLLPRQRTFIRALVQCGGSITQAVKLFNARSATQLTHSQVSRWTHNPDYHRALTAAKQYYLDMAGIDPTSVLLKANHLYEEAMKPAPILHQGRATGYFEQDRGNALRAIEFMGKANGMIGGDEKSTRVTVQIVNLSSRQEKQAESLEGEKAGADAWLTQ